MNKRTLMTVGTFREPKSRIISSFLDGHHHEGMDERDYKVMWNRHRLSKEKNTTLEMLRFAQEYANHPNMIGCQVKMLNGWACYSPTLFKIHDWMLPAVASPGNYTLFINKAVDYTQEFNQTAVDIAIRRLQQFRFVGIFDDFNKSVHLAHKMLSNDTSPGPVELYPQRTTNIETTTLLMEHMDVFDPYDTIIYQEAKKIFNQQTKFYNL